MVLDLHPCDVVSSLLRYHRPGSPRPISNRGTRTVEHQQQTNTEELGAERDCEQPPATLYSITTATFVTVLAAAP